MIVTKIKVNGSRVRLGGYGPQKYQMFALGQLAVRTLKARVARGQGSGDQQMPPLKGAYAKWKARAGKGGAVRNLSLTGEMLGNLAVRYADASKVRMDITSRKARIKARANERRSPWFGFSRADERTIYTAAQRMFRGNIANFGIRLRTNLVGARKPIWLDPLGYNLDRPLGVAA